MSNSQVDQHDYMQTRSVGIRLGLGILLFPIIFVWYLLRPGYSDQARLVGFSWLIVPFLLVIAFGGDGDKTTATQPSPSQAIAAEEVPAPPAKLDEVALGEAALKAKTTLDAMAPSEGEDHHAYNIRVTAAYNRWVAAEEAYRGGNWESDYQSSGISEAYLNCRRRMNGLGVSDGGMVDLSNFNTPADVACHQRGFELHPPVPTLEDYMLPITGDVSTNPDIQEDLVSEAE